MLITTSLNLSLITLPKAGKEVFLKLKKNVLWTSATPSLDPQVFAVRLLVSHMFPGVVSNSTQTRN